MIYLMPDTDVQILASLLISIYALLFAFIVSMNGYKAFSLGLKM